MMTIKLIAVLVALAPAWLIAGEKVNPLRVWQIEHGERIEARIVHADSRQASLVNGDGLYIVARTEFTFVDNVFIDSWIQATPDRSVDGQHKRMREAFNLAAIAKYKALGADMTDDNTWLTQRMSEIYQIWTKAEDDRVYRADLTLLLADLVWGEKLAKDKQKRIEAEGAANQAKLIAEANRMEEQERQYWRDWEAKQRGKRQQQAQQRPATGYYLPTPPAALFPQEPNSGRGGLDPVSVQQMREMETRRMIEDELRRKQWSDELRR